MKRELANLPFNEKAHQAACDILDEFGMLVVYSEDALTGCLTCAFGGYQTKMLFVYYREASAEEWERQSRFLSAHSVHMPPYEEKTSEYHWVLLRIDTHGIPRGAVE